MLHKYREDELREIRSSWTYHAREAILYPDRPVSRRKSVPGHKGWWSAYDTESILGVDCEFVAQKIGVKSSGKPRCKNVAGTISIVNFDGKVIHRFKLKYKPSEIYLTEIMKTMTGFKYNSFTDGEETSVVQTKLREIFKNKLLILINAGSDFLAMGFDKWKTEFDVFDLHENYKSGTKEIGLRSLVHYFYGIDIQAGIHDPDVDAKYTMKIFREQYIPEKQIDPVKAKSRSPDKVYDYIPKYK